MRKVIFALTAAFALVAFLSACGMGLEPAKTDTTSVSLSLTVMSPLGSGGSTDAGRAIIPDGGYLYVRMLGGPTANTPRFLGPYQVRTKSSTISITDIPAGRYDGMFLLYADRVVHKEEVTIKGVATTLGEIFSLPDTDFRAFVKGDDEYEVDVLLAGRASIAMIESPLVVEGVANSFRSTMFPVTPYWIPVEFSMFGYPMDLSDLLYTFDGTVYKSFKGFVGIPGIQMIVSSMYPDYTGNVRLTFSNESTSESMTVNRLSVYDGEGEHTATPSGSFPITMPAGEKYSLDVPMPEPDLDEIFFYLDVSGGTPAITITLDAETITGSLNLADYISNFDRVEGVMFCTKDPTGLFSDTLEEGNSQYLVGWGGLTANDAAWGFYDFNGAINSDSAGSALFLIVVGTKYEQPVMYASTRKYTVSQMSDLAPDMTPLMQYVVVYMGTTGLQSNNGDAATVSIGMSNGPQNLPPDPTVFGDGVVQKIYLNENAPQVYAVIARLTDENGYVVLESGESAIYGFETVYYITLQVGKQEFVNRLSEPVIDGAFVYVNIALP